MLLTLISCRRRWDQARWISPRCSSTALQAGKNRPHRTGSPIGQGKSRLASAHLRVVGGPLRWLIGVSWHLWWEVAWKTGLARRMKSNHLDSYQSTRTANSALLFTYHAIWPTKFAYRSCWDLRDVPGRSASRLFRRDTTRSHLEAEMHLHLPFFCTTSFWLIKMGMLNWI